jgi:predicted transcriptional regulator
LFSNDYTLRILVSLSQMKNMRGCAADIASILDIHNSTTKKYLDLLNRCHVVEKEIIPTMPGKPTFYTLHTKQINLNLDLDIMSRNFQSKSSIPDFLIREKKGNYPQVTFLLNNRGKVITIKVRKRTKAHGYITHNIDLSPTKSRFMDFLPHPTMEPESFYKICTKIQITDFISQKSLYNFVQKLIKLGIIKEYSITELNSRSNQTK